MRTRRLVFAVVLVLAVILAGCKKGGGTQPTPVSPSMDMPTATPILQPLPVEGTTPTATEVFPGDPSLYFEPSVISLAVGETAVVRLWLDGARQLNSISVELSFNSAVVQVDDANTALAGVQIAPGDIPLPTQIPRNEVVVTGQDGRIFYQAAQDPGTGRDGSGVVASIALRSLAEGGSPLRIESVTATDAAGNPFTIAPLSDALITIAAAAGTPTPPPAGTTPQPTEQATPIPGATATPTVPGAATTPTVSATPSAATGSGVYYVVQSGENLYRIGLKFGVSDDAIAAASRIANKDQVPAGTMLLIPVTPTQGNWGYYVQPHDTVYSIARRFGMTKEGLAALNGIGADYHIEVGQVLIVTP